MNIEKQKTHGQPRSKEWPKTRRIFLKSHPICEVCGGKKNLEAHHIVAFHTDTSKELDLTNLIALCEGMDRDCHRLFGHLGNYQSINENVAADAKVWNEKIQHRPKWDKTLLKWVNQ